MTHKIENPLLSALKLATELQPQASDKVQQGLGQITEMLQQLVDSDMVQALELSHSHFVSFMVHELRKPMTSIRGYADMLDKRVVGELNDMQGQFVSTIRRNVISMEKLLADLSDYSKMSSGRLKAENKMDLAKNILLDVQKQTAELAKECKQDLVFEVPDGLPLLNLDGTRVKQAVIKLVENSLRYTPEGGQVVVKAQPAEGGLEIIVKDNGVGMMPEELARLGELFFRGDDPIVTNSKGYGLGIPIVLECMKLVNGRLFHESQKNVGSTFGIFLPGMS